MNKKYAASFREIREIGFYVKDAEPGKVDQPGTLRFALSVDAVKVDLVYSVIDGIESITTEFREGRETCDLTDKSFVDRLWQEAGLLQSRLMDLVGFMRGATVLSDVPAARHDAPKEDGHAR